MKPTENEIIRSIRHAEHRGRVQRRILLAKRTVFKSLHQARREPAPNPVKEK